MERCKTLGKTLGQLGRVCVFSFTAAAPPPSKKKMTIWSQNTHLAQAETLHGSSLVVRSPHFVTRPTQQQPLHGAAHLDDESEMGGG